MMYYVRRHIEKRQARFGILAKKNGDPKAAAM